VSEYLLELLEIRKSFGSNPVLNGVTLQVKPGTIHGLIGKNGAGKSTLMKILNGVVAKDSGAIMLKGQPVEITSVKQAQNYGISMVYQDLNLFPDLTVAENIFVGRYHQNGLVKHGMIELEKVFLQAQNLLDRLKFKIDARIKISHLGLGQQQMVEIARAISQQASILILDEPTAALNEREVGHFLQVLREIQRLGVTIIYITHRLKEIKEIAQYITVIRDGVSVASFPANNIEGEAIIKLMVGEEALGRYPKLNLAIRKEILRIENLSMGNVLSDISFKLHEGEILGIAGLAGSGRSTLINSIFGVGVPMKGRIFLRGREIKLKSPRHAIKLGFAYLAEDRTRAGLFNNLPVKFNITSSNLKRVTKKGIIDFKQESQIAQGLAKRLGMVLYNVIQRVSTLSGGNQQKTVLAKWLFSGGYIYLLDEPTFGLDIASKVDLYNILNSLACGGSGVIMISSDFSELIGMCHRILVISKGGIAGELKGPEISEEKIFKLASAR
jgi:ribose transport system ATP-binding protein